MNAFNLAIMVSSFPVQLILTQINAPEEAKCVALGISIGCFVNYIGKVAKDIHEHKRRKNQYKNNFDHLPSKFKTSFGTISVENFNKNNCL